MTDFNPKKDIWRVLSLWFFKLRLWLLFHVVFPFRLRLATLIAYFKNRDFSPLNFRTWLYIQKQRLRYFAQKLESLSSQMISSSNVVLGIASLLIIGSLILVVLKNNSKEKADLPVSRLEVPGLQVPSLQVIEPPSKPQGKGWFFAKPSGQISANKLSVGRPASSGVPSSKAGKYLAQVVQLVGEEEFCKAQKLLKKKELQLNQVSSSKVVSEFSEVSEAEKYAANGLLELQFGNFPKAWLLLQRANVLNSSLFEVEPVLQEARWIALVASEGERSLLSDFMDREYDCEINNLNKSRCLQIMATWHSRIVEIEKNPIICSGEKSQSVPVLEDDLGYSLKAIKHLKQEIVLLGESQGFLRQAIQSTDGPFRAMLLRRLEGEKAHLAKRKMLLEHKQYLAKHKLKGYGLSKEELSL